MPIRKPSIVTAARLNALQDRVLDVSRDGQRDAVAIVCDPLRVQRGVDFTGTPISPATGWVYDVSGGFARNPALGGLDEDYSVIGFELEEGDQIVGLRALVYRTIASPASGMRVGISQVADGVFPPLSAAAFFDAAAPVGVWTLLEFALGPLATAGKSFGLHLYGSVSTPNQRLGMAAVLVQRP